jgi:hypothetical protein
MFQTLSRITLGFGLAAAVPAMAADPPDRLTVLPDTAGSAVWDHAFPDRAPLSDRQRETDRVGVMARQLEHDEAADRNGEDALGTGTSLTH